MEGLIRTVFAQPPTSLIPASGRLATGGTPVCNFFLGEFDFLCIPLYIGYLIELLLGFTGGFFLLGVMIAGYKYMFGAVTEQGTEQGKKELIARCIGLAIIVLSFLLVDTILEMLF